MNWDFFFLPRDYHKCCLTCRLLNNTDKRSDPLLPSMLRLQTDSREHCVFIGDRASPIFDKLPPIIYLFSSLLPSPHQSLKCSSCMRFLLGFFHLNRIRATHRLGKADRLLRIWWPLIGTLSSSRWSCFSNSWLCVWRTYTLLDAAMKTTW